MCPMRPMQKFAEVLANDMREIAAQSQPPEARVLREAFALERTGKGRYLCSKVKCTNENCVLRPLHSSRVSALIGAY